jgi:four helix bundle protein
MQDYKKLAVWNKAMAFVDVAYEIAAKLPVRETYGLSSQLQRAAVSIPSNLAEGRSRQSSKDFARFVEIALGSAFECETVLLIIRKRYDKLAIIIEAAFPQIEEIKKMTYALYGTLKA